MTTFHSDHCIREFQHIAAVLKLFGPPDLAAARNHPVQARLKQHRLIAATGGVSSVPTDSLRNTTVNPVSSPLSAPTDVVLIYIHGGGLVFYDTAIYQPWLQLLSNSMGRTIIAIDYPRAPETAPAEILSFVLAECRGLAKRRSSIALAGDSVGALIALWLATVGAFRADSLLMIAPLLRLESNNRRGACDVGVGRGLDPHFLEWFRALARDLLPSFNPTGGGAVWAGVLPPTCVVSPTCDPLFAEAAPFVRSLLARGRRVDHVLLPGLPHDFWLYPAFESVRGAAALVATAIKAVDGTT